MDPTQTQARVVLRRCGLFQGLAPDWLDAVAQISVMRTFEKGTTIFHQGDECLGMYVVSAGCVRVFKVAPNGKDHVLHFARPGDTFAEVAVLGDFPCPANAEASETSTCVFVPKPALAELLLTHHELCRQLLSGMALWVRRLVSLLEDIVLRDASGRLARYLLEADASNGKESFVLPVLKKDLASHLNLTSETLSRTLRRFADEGLIDLDGPRLRVVDGAALGDVAEGVLPAEFAK